MTTSSYTNLVYGLESYLQILLTDPVITEEAESTPTTEDATYAVFQHAIADIFTEVKLRTATIGKRNKDPKSGEVLFDEIAITDDETDIFNSFCRSAANRIFDAMTARAKSIVTAFIFNEGPTITTYSSIVAYAIGDYISYNSKFYICIQAGTGKAPDTETEYWTEQPEYIDTIGKISIMINFPEAFDTNSIKIIDRAIFESIVYFIMAEWFEQVQRFELAGNWKVKFEEHISSLKWNLTKTKTDVKRNAIFP